MNMPEKVFSFDMSVVKLIVKVGTTGTRNGNGPFRERMES